MDKTRVRIIRDVLLIILGVIFLIKGIMDIM